MKTIVLIIQTVFAILLIIFISIQATGTGLGRVWGSTGSSSFTRRGLEKLIFKLTFVISAIFVIISIISIGL